jgi:hypothetical protein
VVARVREIFIVSEQAAQLLDRKDLHRGNNEFKKD